MMVGLVLTFFREFMCQVASAVKHKAFNEASAVRSSMRRQRKDGTKASDHEAAANAHASAKEWRSERGGHFGATNPMRHEELEGDKRVGSQKQVSVRGGDLPRVASSV